MPYLMQSIQKRTPAQEDYTARLKNCPKARYCIEYLWRKIFGRTIIKVNSMPTYKGVHVLSSHNIIVEPQIFENPYAIKETLKHIIESQNPEIEVTEVRRVPDE